MFCKKCGMSIDDDSKFCSYCGTDQSYTDQKTMRESLQQDNSVQGITHAVKNKHKPVGCIFAVVIFVLLIC